MRASDDAPPTPFGGESGSGHEPVGQAEYRSRRHHVQTIMARTSIDCLLVTEPSGYRYLCGHQNSQFAIGQRPSLLILPVEGDPVLIIPASEVDQARRQSAIADVRGYAEFPFNPARLGSNLAEMGLGDASIGCEFGPSHRLHLSQSALEAARRELPRARLVDGSAVLGEARVIKSDLEIALIGEASGIAIKALERFFSLLRPGASLADCRRLALISALQAGADPDPPAIVSFGSGPRDGVYGKGDLLQIDLALSYRGYRADLTRRAALGPPTGADRGDHDRIVDLQRNVFESIRPGIPAREVALKFADRLTALGYPRPSPGSWIGHGIGLDLLETPYLDFEDQTPLQPGMVLTPEPWFVSRGQVVMVEDTGVVTETGFRSLVPDPFDRLRQLTIESGS
ncbi:MAG: M24 family metallopeptidase [Candidatus Dormibacteraceae bacterium]